MKCLLLLCCLASSVWGVPLQARVVAGGVDLSWSGGEAAVYRATSPLLESSLRQGRLPLVSQVVQGSVFHDRELADGVDYYYLAQVGSKWLTAGPVRLPARTLPVARHPWLRVDKSRYLLSVMQGQSVLKRYPIAMGSRPFTRKLCYDNTSTPEGRYRIIGLQQEATYYRAYDIDYPNAADRARCHLLAPTAEIGSEIQIHGRGIRRNWTFGCMALRDEDMDELFAHPEIGVGTAVWIYGGELTLPDLLRDAGAGAVDRMMVGRRQQRRGLPVTCLGP